MSYWQKDTKCKDVPFQTYECCYRIYVPWLCKFPWEDDSEKKKCLVCIDKCLLPEILQLWEMGIKTTGNCCGHGKLDAFISVTEENINKMKKLGYEVCKLPDQPEREDRFIPKTKLVYETAKCTEF